MKSDSPLSCNMAVFTPAQRESHIAATLELMHSIQSVHEIEKGYEFTFPNETELIAKIAEFISNERLCCPFLEFTLHILPGNEPASLALTGPIGTHEFLRLEFDGIIQ